MRVAFLGPPGTFTEEALLSEADLAGAAVLLGGYLVYLAQRLRVDATRRNAVVLFHYSLAYLALLFVAAAVNPVVV